MPLLVLKIPPDQQGYAAADGEEALAVQLDGGEARYRRGLEGAAASIDVSWTTDAAGFTYLRAFHQLTGRKGLPFSAPLVLDGATLQLYEAHFVPGSFALASVSGLTYRVKAKLEAKPLPPDDAAAQAVVDGYVP